MANTQNLQTGQALVDFSLYGTFPEENISSQYIAAENLVTALESLAAAKSNLEVRPPPKQQLLQLLMEINYSHKFIR